MVANTCLRTIKTRLVLLLAALVFCATLQKPGPARGEAPQVESAADWPLLLQRVHSHNDYQQKRPLLDAVEAGINSVEADLWLENGKLLVGHDRGKWRGEFETLYLQPLEHLSEQGKLPGGEQKTFLLWLDLKDENPELRSSLRQVLEAQPFMHRLDLPDVRLEVILTGNKAAKETYVEEYSSPNVTRDSNIFSDDDPLGSTSWSWYALDWKKLSTWKGTGDMPAADRTRLHELVTKIHNKQRKLRLWNHPSTLPFRQEALAAGVDRIGTDTIPPLKP
jgi:hypothetical protein